MTVGETAKGNYPERSVETMMRIIRAAEQSPFRRMQVSTSPLRHDALHSSAVCVFYYTPTGLKNKIKTFLCVLNTGEGYHSTHVRRGLGL